MCCLSGPNRKLVMEFSFILWIIPAHLPFTKMSAVKTFFETRHYCIGLQAFGWCCLPGVEITHTHTHTHTVYLSGHASEWAYLCTFKEFDSGFTSLSIYSLRNRHTAICCGRRGGVAFKTFPLLTWVKLGQWLQPFTPAWDTYVFLVYVRAYKSVTDTRVQTTKNRT